MNFIKSLVPILRTLLQGEPLRAIGYGAIAVVFLVTRGLVAFGYRTDAPSLDEIVLAVGTAVTVVTELARRYVYSPNSVANLLTDLAAWASDGVAPNDPTGITVTSEVKAV